MQLENPTVSTSAFAKNKSCIDLAVKFGAIAIAIIVLYFQDLSMVFKNALTDESAFHILVVPFLIVYLFYRKRRMVNSAIEPPRTNTTSFMKYFSTIAGVLLCTTALLTYSFGSYTFTPLEYHMITLPFFAAGLILIFFNPQTLKQLFFPLAFLIFLTPPPAEILYNVGSTLSNLIAEAANALSNLFGVHSTLSTNYGSPLIILTRPDQTQMNFNVDVACSGIYSLIGFIIFSVFVAYITRGKMRNKLTLFLMGIPLIIALNIVRITTIIGIGNSYGDELALQVFHSIGGTVLIFIGTLILLAVSEKVFKKPKPSKSCVNCYTNPPPETNEEICPDCGKLRKCPDTKLSKGDIAKIVSIAMIVIVLLSMQAPLFALTESPAQIIIQIPSVNEEGNTEILPQIQGYTLSFLYRDKEFEQLSGQDASLAYIYAPNATGKAVYVSIEMAQSTSSLHRWETCLVNYPLSQGLKPRITQLDLRDIQTQDNPPIVARYFAFKDNLANQTQIVLYWYETAVFNFNGTSQQRHVKMSLIVYAQTSANFSEIENQLLPFAQAINNYWQPIKTWTAIALSISQNGLTLSAATSTLLVMLIFYSFFNDRREKILLLRLYSKLPQQDQLLLKAVNNVQKTGNSTTNDIINEYQKLSNTNNSQVWVLDKLQTAENTGLIKKKLINQNDQPAMVWKNQVPNIGNETQKWLRRITGFNRIAKLFIKG